MATVDVLVTGASGFIGTALVTSLRAAGHRPVIAYRTRVPKGADGIAWDPDAGSIDAASLEGIDAVVHLAGAGIGDRRWTAARKRVIRDSRTRGTRLVARTLAALERRPAVMVSASAVGIYGNRGDERLTEVSAPGDDFLAGVCMDWEASTRMAEDAGIRVVHARTGVVLGPGGGILGRLALPFRLGVGGRLGAGTQHMSWIALTDQVRALEHALVTPALAGSVNLTAPEPVTNAEFTRTLARVLRRPSLIPTPLTALRARYGRELVEGLLLASQRAVPEALSASGFVFEHPTLEPALRSALGATPEG